MKVKSLLLRMRSLHFFKKLNFSNSQKEIFNSYVEEFFFKNSENNHRDIFLKFFKSFK